MCGWPRHDGQSSSSQCVCVCVGGPEGQSPSRCVCVWGGGVAWVAQTCTLVVRVEMCCG